MPIFFLSIDGRTKKPHIICQRPIDNKQELLKNSNKKSWFIFLNDERRKKIKKRKNIICLELWTMLTKKTKRISKYLKKN